MRKDIQFGLTIGGLLLAVLVIYLAVFTHTARRSQDVTVAQGPATQPSDAHTAPLDVTQTTTPVSGGADSVATARVETGATTQPVADAGNSSSNSSTARDWSALLSGSGSTTQPAMMSVVSSVPAAGGTTTEGMVSPTAATNVASATTGASTTHKVAPGESFYSIAKAVYGDSKYFSRLVDANPTVQANRLRVGTVINVPALSATTDTATDAASTTTAGTAGAKAAADTEVAGADVTGSTAALDPSKSYRVKPSDTLMGIARRLYGDGQAWDKIYDANRDTIGPNPARLKVDMVLRLPEAPTVAVAN